MSLTALVQYKAFRTSGCGPVMKLRKIACISSKTFAACILIGIVQFSYSSNVGSLKEYSFFLNVYSLSRIIAGIYSAMAIFGPALGFSVGGLFLATYTDVRVDPGRYYSIHTNVLECSLLDSKRDREILLFVVAIPHQKQIDPIKNSSSNIVS